MTLDEAIKHCEKVADDQKWLASSYDEGSMGKELCDECAEKYKQFARWLRELNRKREMLDKLEEAYHELDSWDFLEYCEKLWGEADDD